MGKNWWKAATIILLFFILISTWIIPLGPGILDVSKARAETGVVNLDITGYNTRFQSAENSLQCWLSFNGVDYCSNSNNVTDEAHLTSSFEIPEEAGNTLGHLFINNDLDGTVILTEAVYVEKSGNGSGASCAVQVANKDEDYFAFPNKAILIESIRNLNFHVPMWFSMMIILFYSLINSIKYLRNSMPEYDIRAREAVHVALLLGALGIATGSVWARFTWNFWWVNDAKLNGAVISALIYAAYFVLRGSIPDEEKRARVSAVYSIFAYVMLVLFLFILPRTTVSLHPGNGGNPAFSQYDLDNNMRMFFYPAIIAWTLLATWMVSLRIRLSMITRKLHYGE